MAHFDEKIKWPGRIGISGDFIYILDSYYGFLIIDMNGPENLVLVDNYDLLVAPFDIVVKNKLAYVVGGRGLRIVDISNPENPFIIGENSSVFNLVAIEVSDDYAYVADGVAGFNIIDISSCDGY